MVRYVTRDDAMNDDETPSLHPNTFKNLREFLDSLNLRRLHVTQFVDVLSSTGVILGSGQIIEIIPPKQFADNSGEFHGEIICVRMNDTLRPKWYAPFRVVPHIDDDDLPLPSKMDREVPFGPYTNEISRPSD